MAFRSLLSLCALASQALAPQGTLVTCHTAVEGEECYDIVVWAMTTGIRDRPEWYPGLDASSTFREFQQFHYDHPEYRVLQCSPPCPEADGTCCCVATNATQPQCYNDILWALTVGIHSNPEWYPGLTANSSWVEFQSYVAGQDDRCGLPCVDQSSHASSTTKAAATTSGYGGEIDSGTDQASETASAVGGSLGVLTSVAALACVA